MTNPYDTSDRPWLAGLPRTPLGPLLLIAAGAVFVSLGAQFDKEIGPVPLSLQTYAVLVVGAVLRPTWAAAALVLYLIAGASGLPVFADGAAGVEHLKGRTAGYLLGFPIAAWLVSLAMDRWVKASRARLLIVMLVGHVVILALGTAWLATSIGVGPAIEHGLLPFLLAGLVKSLLAMATVLILRTLFRGGS